MKTMRICATLLLVAGVILVVLAQGPKKIPFTIGKETTIITAPLHTNGTPDYVAAINERYRKGITPENNAFVAWLEVIGTDSISEKRRAQMLKMCGAKESPSLWTEYGDFLKRRGIVEAAAKAAEDDQTKATKRLWDAKDFPLVAEWLKENDAALDKTKEAFSRSKYWMPSVAYNGRSMISVLLPSLPMMKPAANGLCARATLRAKAGDFDGFLSDVMAVKRMARHVSQKTTIACLVGVAIDSIASRCIGAVAGSGILSAKQCAELEKAINALEPLPRIWEAVDISERWYALDNVAMLTTDREKQPDSDLLFEGLPLTKGPPFSQVVDLASVDWDAVMKRINRVYDTLLEHMKKTDWEEMKRESDKLISQETEGLGTDPKLGIFGAVSVAWLKKREEGGGETREAYTHRIGGGMISLSVSSTLGSAEILYRRSVMEHEMAKSVIAASRYRAEEGQWPEGLDALVPEYLKEVPTDMYSGKNVLYVRGEKGIRVYSVGPNRQDDGGIPNEVKDGKHTGDFVIGVEVE
ncbi:MAG: hypothetical protein FWD53_02705 [Phycisphaerales bacterium]|nr:hypothetical protein [Phycisphaerales bacterium]